MKNNRLQNIDSIAEQWVNLVLSHIRAKRLIKNVDQRGGKYGQKTNGKQNNKGK